MKKILYKFVCNYWSFRFFVLTIILISGDNIQAQCTPDCSGVNTILGEFAGASITTGMLNTLIGNTAGGLNSEGYGNSCFGHTAGLRVTGNKNSFYGVGAGQNITAGSSNICIGSTAGPPEDSAISYRLFIDVDDTIAPLIYGEFDNDFIKINGTFEVASGLTNPSSILLKQQFKSLTPSNILQKLNELNIMEWSYKSDPGVRHIGPTAEAFHRAFGLGMDDRTISTIDADGVALIAIQALYEKVQENEKLSTRIDEYEKKNKELEARLLKLESILEP